MRRFFLHLALLVAVLCGSVHAAADRPCIVVILADDLGYGDIQYLNPARGKRAPHTGRCAGCTR